LAFWVAELAGERGQPRGPWFIASLLLPGLTLLVVLVAFPRVAAQHPPTADDAVAASPVARALAESPRASVHQLVARTGLPEREVVSQLRALEILGRVSRDDTGHFDLSPA
jgi:predicted Rossmann fold nucleotide-binding protein DprA/Smf involved in DNA uptake